jgi:hypothetical protein
MKEFFAACVAWMYVNVYSRLGFDKPGSYMSRFNLAIVVWILSHKGFTAMEQRFGVQR